MFPVHAQRGRSFPTFIIIVFVLCMGKAMHAQNLDRVAETLFFVSLLYPTEKGGGRRQDEKRFVMKVHFKFHPYFRFGDMFWSHLLLFSAVAMSLSHLLLSRPQQKRADNSIILFSLWFGMSST